MTAKVGALTREFSGMLDDDDVNEISFQDLVLIEQIGKGSFGRVWKGKYPTIFYQIHIFGGYFSGENIVILKRESNFVV